MTEVSYTFTMPIPKDLWRVCPDEFGFEIFVHSEQVETADIIFPVMALLQSTFDEDNRVLTAVMYPNIWVDRSAKIIISCTPGGSNVRGRRRLQFSSQVVKQEIREKEQSSKMAGCPASEIEPPVEGDRFPLVRAFSR